MQGREVQLIGHVDVEAARLEEVEAQRLVLLSRNMQEAGAKTIP